MIKITTESGTTYIIDQDNKTIKRIPTGESKLDSIFKGMINVGQFQPYRDIDPLEIGNKLYVTYSNEQLWTVSTPITEIDYEYEENN